MNLTNAYLPTQILSNPTELKKDKPYYFINFGYNKEKRKLIDYRKIHRFEDEYDHCKGLFKFDLEMFESKTMVYADYIAKDDNGQKVSLAKCLGLNKNHIAKCKIGRRSEEVICEELEKFFVNTTWDYYGKYIGDRAIVDSIRDHFEKKEKRRKEAA